MTDTDSGAFQGFPKIARLSREAIISEKLDGTSGCIFVWDQSQDPVLGSGPEFVVTSSLAPAVAQIGDLLIAAGSRSRWITPKDDNYGFAKWVSGNAEQLATLGHGRHFGEYWGQGIQRNYGLKEKRFSLFNTIRWCLHGQTPQPIPTGDPRISKVQDVLPECVGLVPVLWRGIFSTSAVDVCLDVLRVNGSRAVPGFPNPEGVVVYHTGSGTCFKKTLTKDEGKG